MFKFGRRFLIGFTAIGFSTAAFTQPSSNRHDGTPDGRTIDNPQNPEEFADRVARKQSALRDALRLTAAQEPAWQTFTEQTRPTAPMTLPEKSQMAKLTAPQRMEQMLATMREGEQRLQVRLEATTAFYAVLTASQQGQFDRQFSGRPHHGPRGASPWEHPDGE